MTDARLDAQVRSALTDLPAPDDMATRAALDTVVRRSRALRPVPPSKGRSWVVPATAAAVAVILVATLATAFLGRSEPPVPAPGAPSSLVGSWERQVRGAETPGWNGRWRMTLSADGVMSLAGPTRAADSVEGASYAESRGRLRVDVFVNSACPELPAGVYGWARDSGGLRLTLDEDPCRSRADLFVGRWQPAP